MIKQFGIAAQAVSALLWAVSPTGAQHGHGHGGHSSGIHIGIGGSGHGGAHIDFGGHGHGGVRVGGHGFVDSHHPSHHYVLPHHSAAHHGTYYLDGGINYYTPQPYVARTRSYVVAKPIAVQFGGYSHVDDLSGRLERLANELCLDLYHNYRHNENHAQVYREAYQVLATAKYIHAKEHQGDRAEVARRLDEVDDLFHHVQGEVQNWSRRDYRQVGQGAVSTKLALVESGLHHLMNDVGVQGQRHQAAGTASPPTGGEIAPPPEPANIPAIPQLPPPARGTGN